MTAKGIGRWLPGIGAARTYKRAWLWPDVRAGLVVTALLIPAGMGYAEVAGLPPEAGLYATIVPLIAYAVFGPSRILVLGPDSSLAPIIAAAILPLALGGDERAVALAACSRSWWAGCCCSAASCGWGSSPTCCRSRSGWATSTRSRSSSSSRRSRSSSASRSTRTRSGRRSSRASRESGGEVQPLAAAFGLGSLVVIFVLKWLRSPVPGVLVVVVLTTVITAIFGLRVAARRRGAPAGPSRPRARRARVGGRRGARAARGRHRARRLHRQRRAVAHASPRAAARGWTAARRWRGSASRTSPAACSAGSRSRRRRRAPRSPSRPGSRTQLTGVVGAALIIAFILLVPGLTEYLPSATLAAVVISAAVGLIDVRGFRASVRMDKVDAAMSLAAFLGVLVFGVLQGIVVTIGLSLLAFVIRSWRPYKAELGRVAGLRGYHDLSRYPEGERLPGIVIVRFDAPLFFANGATFDDYVRSRVEAAGPGVHP